MGNLADRSLAQAAAANPGIRHFNPAFAPCPCSGPDGARGEDVAASLGIRPRRLGLEVIALSAIAVGACVSVAGAIGFVGLVAPVFGRSISRGHPGSAFPPP
jgi:iron complex transport system permease protein